MQPQVETARKLLTASETKTRMRALSLSRTTGRENQISEKSFVLIIYSELSVTVVTIFAVVNLSQFAIFLHLQKRFFEGSRTIRTIIVATSVFSEFQFCFKFICNTEYN